MEPVEHDFRFFAKSRRRIIAHPSAASRPQAIHQYMAPSHHGSLKAAMTRRLPRTHTDNCRYQGLFAGSPVDIIDQSVWNGSHARLGFPSSIRLPPGRVVRPGKLRIGASTSPSRARSGRARRPRFPRLPAARFRAARATFVASGAALTPLAGLAIGLSRFLPNNCKDAPFPVGSKPRRLSGVDDPLNISHDRGADRGLIPEKSPARGSRGKQRAWFGGRSSARLRSLNATRGTLFPKPGPYSRPKGPPSRSARRASGLAPHTRRLSLQAIVSAVRPIGCARRPGPWKKLGTGADKKSPAQGGPTRGSSALGLGGNLSALNQRNAASATLFRPHVIFLKNLAVF